MTTIPTQPGLSLFEIPPRTVDPTAALATVFESAELAERLGYETYWLAEGHFSDIGSPSALTLLAGLTQRTSRIRLGTAVIPLALDNPLRIAETAAVVNTISGNRVELGIGKGNPGGFSAAAYHAFGLDEAERESLYATTLERLRAAFTHTEVGANGVEYGFYPPDSALLGRIWQATGNVDTARKIGRAGDGLQLHRFVPGKDTGNVQRGLVEAYLESLEARAVPRIGVSRSVLPARDAAEAVEIFAAHFAARPFRVPGSDLGNDPQQILANSYILHGSPEQIVESLLGDPTVTASTDYLFNVPLGYADEHYRASLALIANEIYPHLPVAQHGKAGVVASAVV